MSDMDILMDRLTEALREPDFARIDHKPKRNVVELVEAIRNEATTFAEAVALIELYGRACVSEGRCDATVANFNKTMREIA